MRAYLHLRHLLTLGVSLLTCALIALMMLTIGKTGELRLEQEIGASLRLLADQMQDKLDRVMFERYREIGSAARMIGQLDLLSRPQDLEIWFKEFRASHPDYSWLGMVNSSGRIVLGADGLLVGTDVSDEPWFKSSLQEATVGEVRQLRQFGDGPASRTDRYLAVSAPVLDQTGRTSGALTGLLDWNWAEEVRDSLVGKSSAGGVEVLVLDAAGAALLGPADLPSTPLDLKSVRAAMTGHSNFSREDWPDGHSYVTGFARSDGHSSFSGLGWLVLVRQDADVALEPVTRLRNRTLFWSASLAALGLIVAWLLSRWLAKPLLELSGYADRVRQGELIAIPHLTAYSEAAVLSRSLSALVAEMTRHQNELERLNQSLETQVERRTAELAARNEALTLARAEAELATAAKSRFLAAASHDLRQPLHAMSLFARALSRRVAGDEAKTLVAQLETSLTSLRAMFEALLNVSRLDAGLTVSTPETIQLDDLVERVTNSLRPEAEARGLRLVQRAIGASATTDPALLETMLRNLASNAVKFTRTGGVLLATRRRGSEVVIEVWDSGPGIEEGRKESIFNEFERTSAAAGGANDGLGLGLAIVRRYAQLLKIDVRVCSRPGHGTRFSMHLAESVKQTVNSGAIMTATQAIAIARLKVILIDDDQAIVEALGRDLADRGCLPSGFTSSETAMAAIKAGLKVDAAIVDYDLGAGETGPACLERIERELGSALPSLVLSGGTDSATMAKLVATGRPWLTKPADPDVIAETLARLVSSRRFA